MARAQQTLKNWQLSVMLLLGFLCLSLQAVPHTLDSRLGTQRFASQIASTQCSEFAEDLIGEDRLLELRLTLEITVRTTGDPIAFTNPFRFSTKYVDQESGFLNYGHRLYNPMTGRWLSKDPIEEDGGLNLYGFVLNNSINAYDILGLADDENYEPYSMIELGRLERQSPSFYYDVERDFYEEGLPALRDVSIDLGIELGPLRWLDKLWDGVKWGNRVVGDAGRSAYRWNQFRRFWSEIPKTVKDRVPNKWTRKNNKKGTGFRWVDPHDEGSGIRIDKGNPNSSLPSQQMDHVVVRFRGKVIGRDGKPIKGSLRQNPNAHIPLDEYNEWEKWYAP